MTQRSRTWCFTLNNYVDEDLIRIEKNYPKFQYIIFGFEEGEKEHTPHLQGYVEFNNARVMTAVKKLIAPKSHVEIRKGTQDEAINYCKKEGNYCEHGDRKLNPGTRTDIHEMKKLVNEGATMSEIIEKCDSYQSLKSAELLMKYQKIPPRITPFIIWIYGPTGTGKTHEAITLAGDDYWISSRSLKWWDGYYGQKSVIFDDFRADFCTYHELLRLTDKYPFRVESKGSSQWLRADLIIITSCYPPDKVYNTREDIAQLTRRINKIIQKTEVYKPLDNNLIKDTEVGGNTKPLPCAKEPSDSNRNIIDNIIDNEDLSDLEIDKIL